jgi:hypothetical protein
MTNTATRRRLGHRGLRICGAAIAVAGALLPVAAAARDQSVIPYQLGNPITNGCPAGSEALRVADLAPFGYRLPAIIDATQNGGNGDGIVCGKPFTPQEQAARFPNGTRVPVIFNFRDNYLPSAG